MKRFHLPQILRRPSVATACFLLAAAAVAAGCVWLVSTTARRALDAGSTAAPKIALATPSPVPREDEPALPVGALFVPEQSPGEASAAPTASPAPQPTASPTPLPTLLPVRTAEAYSAAGMDLALYGFDESGQLAWCMLAAYRNGECEILSLPSNVRLNAAEPPISAANSVRSASRMMTEVLPVRVDAYARIRTDRVAACIDLFGGVSVDGVEMDGAAAEAYLDGGGSDELLRIDRRTKLLRAVLRQIRATGWFKLLSMKFAMQEYLTSNLSLAEMTELYTAFRVMDDGDITFATLPVDSVTVDGARYYTPDAALVNGWVSERYPY